jgi:hypothetical protein
MLFEYSILTPPSRLSLLEPAISHEKNGNETCKRHISDYVGEDLLTKLYRNSITTHNEVGPEVKTIFVEKMGNLSGGNQRL